MKKRVLAAVLSAVLLFPSWGSLLSPVRSAPVVEAEDPAAEIEASLPAAESPRTAFTGLSYVTDGISDTDALLPSGADFHLFEPPDSAWTCSGPVRKSYSMRIARLDPAEPTKVYIVAAGPREGREGDDRVLTFDLDLSEENVTADGYAAMQFAVCFESASGDFPLEAVLTTSAGTLSADLTIRAYPVNEPVILFNRGVVRSDNGWSVATIDLSGVTGTVESLSVRIREDLLPENTVLSAPLLLAEPTDELIRAGLYTSFSLEAGTGIFAFSGSEAYASADEDGRALLMGSPATVAPIPANVPCCFEIRTTGLSAADGRLSVGIDYRDGLERVWSPVVRLNAPDNVYVVPVEVFSEISAFSLLFEGLDPGSGFRLDSIRIYSGGPASPGGNDWLGKLSRIERSGDAVVFGGTMVPDAVHSFSGSALKFYAMPSPALLDAADDAFFSARGPVSLPESAVQVGEFKISTRFESRFTLPALPANADSCVFFACVEDPESEGSVLLLSPPRYADAEPRTAAEPVSSFGLADTFPAGVFESNAFHILTDVRLDDLLDGSGGISVAYAVPGESSPRSASLDSSLLSELDRDAEFYRSAGIAIYLRFRIDEGASNLTAPGSLFPDTDSPASTALWCALVRFFAARYPYLAGMILPGPVNDAGFAGNGSDQDAGALAERISHLCRLTYNAAVRQIPGIEICVPFDGRDETSAVGCRALMTLFASRIASTGSFPWTCLLCAGADDDAPARLRFTLSLLDGLSLPQPEKAAYIYQLSQQELEASYADYLSTPAAERTQTFVPSEMAVELYLNFVKACGSGHPVVFFSPALLNQRYDHDFYDVLKRGTGEKGAVKESGTRMAHLLPGLAMVDLWDFTDKYYPLDWIPGGGALSCSTEQNALYSERLGTPARVLSVSFQETEDGVAGIAMRNLRNTTDFSSVDALYFDFLLADESGNGDNGVSLVFIVGTDEKRAEFHADGLRCGEIMRLSCPVSEWDDRGRVDFVGIAVYSAAPVTLKLSKVTAVSAGLSEEELRAVFQPSPEPVEPPDTSWLLPVLVFMAALTFAVFVLLTRRDSEEGADEERRRP